MLSLVHDELLDASQERFFIQGLGSVLVRRKKFEYQLVRGLLVVADCVYTTGAVFAVSSSIQLLLRCFHLLVLVPHLDVNGSACLLSGLALW